MPAQAEVKFLLIANKFNGFTDSEVLADDNQVGTG